MATRHVTVNKRFEPFRGSDCGLGRRINLQIAWVKRGYPKALAYE